MKVFMTNGSLEFDSKTFIIMVYNTRNKKTFFNNIQGC